MFSRIRPDPEAILPACRRSDPRSRMDCAKIQNIPETAPPGYDYFCIFVPPNGAAPSGPPYCHADHNPNGRKNENRLHRPAQGRLHRPDRRHPLQSFLRGAQRGAGSDGHAGRAAVLLPVGALFPALLRTAGIPGAQGQHAAGALPFFPARFRDRTVAHGRADPYARGLFAGRARSLLHRGQRPALVPAVPAGHQPRLLCARPPDTIQAPPTRSMLRPGGCDLVAL